MKKEININGTIVGDSHPPYIIAEMSANHNGSMDRAFETIKAAAECGVNAIKMQTYTADTMTIDCDKEDFMIRGGLWDGYKLYDLYKWAETPYEWHKNIFEYAKNVGITLFSTPFDESAVDLLEDLNTPAYKIASFELLDIPLIKYVAKTKKPLIISTGMANYEEISDAVDAVLSEGNEELILLHCVSSYPAPAEKYNLQRIKLLKKRFGCLIGLSDHSMVSTTSVASIALGASVIEKHFTLSREDKGPDCEFSLEPKEFKDLCAETKTTWKALNAEGDTNESIQSQSKDLRRSIYFIKDKSAGETINVNDIKRIRPGKGLAPKFIEEIIGLKLKYDVKRGDPTNWDLFYK
ncbi:pseudaminic acid synthase [Prochlorococcus sp. AH-716-M10]|nr:pseudaminic acid synthase [Prochlorococcus sp. AH-716-M10]